MRRQILKTTGTIMAAAMVLAGCGAKQDTAATTAASTQAATEAASETTAAATEAATETASEAATEAASTEGGALEIVATSEDYVKLFDSFTADTGIETEMLSMSSGEVLSKIRAEGGTPMADLWFGGGIDAFMNAKSDDLIEEIKLDTWDELNPTYVDPDHYWLTKGLTVVGFIVNDDILQEKGLKAPETWDDLTDDSYKSEILMSNPAISGTNYGVVNAILQKKGEDDGWKYFETLNNNIDYYSKRGGDPREKTAQGEIAIGITPMDKKTEKLTEEQNCSLIYPADGIPYIPEGVAVFKNAAHTEEAMQFLNWLYSSDDHLKMLAEIDGKDTVKVVKPNIDGLELTFDTETLMEEDLSLFGSKRDEILEKWDALAGDKSEA